MDHLAQKRVFSLTLIAFIFLLTPICKAQPSTLWDTQFAYSATDTTFGDNALAGCIFFGNSFWVSSWAADTIYELSRTGQYISEFYLPNTGCFRSLTTDGNRIYGANVTWKLYSINPFTKTVADSITPQLAFKTRFCTYDPTLDNYNGGFWVGNYDQAIVSIDRAGAVLDSIPLAVHGFNKIYGAAWDGASDGGPYLWIFNNGGTNFCQIDKLGLPSGINTTDSRNVALDHAIPFGQVSPRAGGLFLSTGIFPGQRILGGIMQGNGKDVLFGYELEEPYMQTDSILYRQNKYSTEFYFQPHPSLNCVDYIYVWDFGDGNTQFNICQPTHYYDSLAPYSVTLQILDTNYQVISSHTESLYVDCPTVPISFEVIPVSPDSITLINTTVLPPFWPAAANPVNYYWTVGGIPLGSSPILGINPSWFGSCRFEITLGDTSGCSSSSSVSETFRAGYTQDLPKDLAFNVSSKHYTPISWKEAMTEFPNDSDLDRLDDRMGSLNSTIPTPVPKDVLVYYFIPPGGNLGQILAGIQGYINRSSEYETFDRFSDNLTVFSVRKAHPTWIKDLIAENYVAYIEFDTTFYPYSSISTTASFLQAGELMETLGLDQIPLSSCPNPNQADGLGNGQKIGTCILGAGHSGSFAFASLATPACSGWTGNPPVPPNPYASFVGTGNSIFTSCLGTAVTNDDIGFGASKTSLLTMQNHLSANTNINGGFQVTRTDGIISGADYYFFDVFDDATLTMRASDIVQAMDSVIGMRRGSPHIDLVLCDFTLPYVSEGNDAVSSIMEVASRRSITVVAGTGMMGAAGLTPPGAAPSVITVAPFLYDGCQNPIGVGGGAGMGNSNNSYWAKPDICAPANVFGANRNWNNFFNQAIASPEVGATILSGLCTKLCHKNRNLSPSEVKLLLTSGADDQRTLGAGPIPDAGSGHGLVNIAKSTDNLVLPECYHLGFEEHVNSDVFMERHNSKDLRVLVPVAQQSNSPVISYGDRIKMEVEIFNFGNNDYPGLEEEGLIQLKVHYFANDEIVFLSENITKPIPFIPAGGKDTIQIPFTTNFTTNVICGGATIVCPRDTSKFNNDAKQNDYRFQLTPQDSVQLVRVGLTAPGDDSVCVYTINSPAVVTDYIITPNFFDTCFAANELPMDIEYKFELPPNSNPPLVFDYDVTFCAYVPGGDTIYNGGVHFTIYNQNYVEIKPPTLPIIGNLEIFPNPTQESFQARLTPNHPGDLHLDLIDLQGKVLHQRSTKGRKGAELLESFDLSSYPSGIYLLRIILGNAVLTRRVVKI